MFFYLVVLLWVSSIRIVEPAVTHISFKLVAIDMMVIYWR